MKIFSCSSEIYCSGVMPFVFLKARHCSWQFVALRGIKHLNYFCKQQPSSCQSWESSLLEALLAQSPMESSRTPMPAAFSALWLGLPVVSTNIAQAFLFWFCLFVFRVSGNIIYKLPSFSHHLLKYVLLDREAMSWGIIKYVSMLLDSKHIRVFKDNVKSTF